MSMQASSAADLLAQRSACALLANDEATRSLGIALIFAGEGEAVLSMTVTTALCNGHGTCHGGFLFALADTAFAVVANSHGERAVGSHCTITYLHPARPGTTLQARAREITRAGRSGLCDVQLTDQEGRIIAVFQGHSRSTGASLFL